MRGATIAVLAALTIMAGGGGAATHYPAACGVVCGDYLPAWSADGKTIAFVRYVHAPGGPRATIWAVPAAGGPARVVVGLDGVEPRAPSGPLGPYDSLLWSPDSRSLAVSSHGAVWTVAATGGATHFIIGTHPSWSPDSRQLAVATQLDIGSFRNQQLVPGEVVVAGADGSARRVLAGTDPSLGGGSWASDPVWASGDEVAYLTGSRAPGSKQPAATGGAIWASRSDGSGARPLVAAGAGWRPLAWSADGQRLFVITSMSDVGELGVVDRLGGTPRQLFVFDARDDCCRLAPDGSRLLDAAQNLEHTYRADLVVVDLASGSQRRILGAVGYETAHGAAWSPGGDRIAFPLGGECGPLSGISTEPADGGRADRITERCRHDGTTHTDAMHGGPGPDALYGHGGNDVIFGGGGSDFLQGGAGDDRIHGGPGNDRLYGGPGVDMLFGNDGNDTIRSRDRSGDVVRCGTGKDTVHADRLDVVSPDCEALYRH